MWTGYFGKLKKYAKLGNYDLVSIARYNKYWNGKTYMKLAPTYEMLSITNKEEYRKQYYEKILSKLDPIAVYNELGKNAVLLCYEKYEDIINGRTFCHRQIVSEWLESNIKGVKVRELDVNEGKTDAEQLSFEFN